MFTAATPASFENTSGFKFFHTFLQMKSDLTSGKEHTHHCRRYKRHGFDPWVGKIPWRRAWQPTPVFFPGESHRQRSLADYSPWGCRVRHDWSNLAHMQHTAWFSFQKKKYIGHGSGAECEDNVKTYGFGAACRMEGGGWWANSNLGSSQLASLSMESPPYSQRKGQASGFSVVLYSR